jgi:hypothetical protein
MLRPVDCPSHGRRLSTRPSVTAHSRQGTVRLTCRYCTRFLLDYVRHCDEHPSAGFVPDITQRIAIEFCVQNLNHKKSGSVSVRYTTSMAWITKFATTSHWTPDGGSKHLWNVGKLLPDYTAQHPRRQSSSSEKDTLFAKYDGPDSITHGGHEKYIQNFSRKTSREKTVRET